MEIRVSFAQASALAPCPSCDCRPTAVILLQIDMVSAGTHFVKNVSV